MQNGHLQIVQYLIEKGANIEAEGRFYSHTPLHVACAFGHLQIVRYLIEKGADIEAKAEKQQRTPLHIASYCGNKEIIEYLISQGADKKAKETDGATPYDIACHDIRAKKSQRPIIRELLK